MRRIRIEVFGDRAKGTVIAPAATMITSKETVIAPKGEGMARFPEVVAAIPILKKARQLGPLQEQG